MKGHSMTTRHILFALAGLSLLAVPSFAQRTHQDTAPHANVGRPAGGAARNGGNFRAPAIFKGGPRGPMQWGEFHHDTAPSRVFPHRFGLTNLPRPNGWRGDIHDFDLARWRGGRWLQGEHGGRTGWWWIVGPDWYYFDAPVYPYPDLYTPMSEPIGWWYWCDPYQEYYPYVTYCPVPWESVMPQE